MDVMEPGAALNRDIAAGEAVEHELDAFISRRHEQRLKSEPERELEAVWRASERVQEARRSRRHGGGGRMIEPCPVCGIPPGDDLTLAAYEALWDAIPDLRAVQARAPRPDARSAAES